MYDNFEISHVVFYSKYHYKSRYYLYKNCSNSLDTLSFQNQAKGNFGAVARLSKVPKTFAKLQPAHSVKPVFAYVVKGTKFKIATKFRA